MMSICYTQNNPFLNLNLHIIELCGPTKFSGPLRRFFLKVSKGGDWHEASWLVSKLVSVAQG